LTDYLTEDYVVNGETGLGSLYPVHWTSDDTYLYFTPFLGFSGGGTCFYYHSRVQGLYRINVNSGFISAVLRTTAKPALYEIAFSPVGAKVAYYGDHLTILDLRTGETTEIDTGGRQVGNLTWSPDGANLAFGTCQATEDYDSIVKSDIKVHLLQSKDVNTIMEVNKSILRIVEWDASFRLKLINSDEHTGDDRQLYYDWISGIVTTPTPTLQP
jgi:dipeptidyl aminopeptidase/acylaminoacyl peptidase